MLGFLNNQLPTSRPLTELQPIKSFAFSKRSKTHKAQPRTKRSFHSFVAKANPRFVFYKHCELLSSVLERVASGELKRVLIQLPPRHSKSELVSRLFAAYYLARNPHHFVGINSYSADLAYTLSRAARENFIQCGGVVKDDVAAVKHWETHQGGGVWAAGVGGSITGKGFHLGIIDDPIKNAEEAASDLIREKHKEWYGSTFYTRCEPDAAIVVIQTRWHEDDLTGWLLDEEKGEEPENWHIVSLPAINDELPQFPPTCIVEPDFRKSVQALCPERYPLPKLKKIKARIGDYHFDALYQQQPTSKKGMFFDVSKLEIVDALPANVRTCRGWDQAATPGDGDFTAGVKMTEPHEGLFYVADVVKGQWDTATRDRTIRQTAETDGHQTQIAGEQEAGSGGKGQAQNFVRMLAGFAVSTEPSTGAKTVRADAFSSQVNAGNVRLLRGDWNKDFIEELRKFPRGKHDDQVDAAAVAFNKVNRGGLGIFI